MKETEADNQPDWDLMAKYLRGEATGEEKRTLFAWINQQPENKELFHQLSNVWNATGWERARSGSDTSDQAFNPDVETAWRRFSELAAIKQSNPDQPSHWPTEPSLTETKTQPLVRNPFKQVVRIAAVLLMVFGAAFWVKFYVSTPKMVPISQSTQEEKRVVFLPDSSKVYLNKNSKLSYAEGFSDGNRVVKLTGEAFFEVRKVKDHSFGKSFVIFSGNAKTEVLGTSFNIRAYPAEKSVEIVVVTGKVAFSASDSTQEKPGAQLDTNRLLLTPGMKATLKLDQGVATSRVEDANALAWKSERLEFNNTQLSVVVATLERYFGVSIQVANPQLLQCRITGTFEKPKLEEILQVLKVAIQVDYSLNHHQYLLSGQGCQ